MAEITVHFDFRMGQRSLRWLMAACMVLAAAPELASESVTLTTYYPAPSGVYTKMITTNQTILARDTGSVGIGTSSPGAKLEVNGTFQTDSTSVLGGATTVNGQLTVNSAVVANAYMPNYAGWASYGTGSGGAAIYNDAGTYKTLMLVGNNSAGGVRQVSVWDQLNVNGAENVYGNEYVSGTMGVGIGSPSAKLDVNGSIILREAGCSDISTTYPAAGGGTQNLCTGSQYVTVIDGVMAQKMQLANSSDPNVDARCCPCIGACPGL